MFLQFSAKDVPRLLHERIPVATASEDSGFKAAGTVGDFAGGNLSEKTPAVFVQLVGGQHPAGDQLPRGQDVLTRSRKTDLPRL